jgi:drug/metabolite transporter (DMT)-like permease
MNHLVLQTDRGPILMVTIFALAAALLYGSADFLGGVATRQSRVLSVLPLSAAAGTAVVVTAALLSGQSLAAPGGLGWGAAGGAVGGAGLIVFYAGLAAGPMSVVAPVSALMATVVPVAFAVAGGERANAAVYAGALLCLAAIVLVSSPGPQTEPQTTPGPRRGRLRRLRLLAGGSFHGRAVAYGLAAGTAFGLFFLFLRVAGQSGPLWPVVSARLAGLAVIILIAAATRTRPVLAGVSARLLLATAGSGAIDAGANICYVIATRDGLFGLAVVLTSLYPGVTVLLARLALGERLHAVQRAGLLLAGIGVVLVTV